jgi:hypothetical protein
MRSGWLVVVGLLCAWAGEARAESRAAQVLIWGGGASRAEAEASLSTYREREKTWAGALTLAEGYPRIVESQSVPGLKPGFVVVVLGACAPEEGAKLLEGFKAFEPAVYAREVAWSEALACPKQGPERRIEQVKSWKKKDGTLTAVVMMATDSNREHAGHQWLLVTVRSPQGKLLESVERSGSIARESFSGSPEFEVELEDGWPKVMTLSLGGGCTGGPNVTLHEETFRIKGAKLEVQHRSELIVDNSNTCD